jgi:diphthine-ammonia ligase
MSSNPGADGDETITASAQTDGTPTLAGRRFFCSWSGGTDAYLAFARAVAAGGRPAALVCMLHEDGERSRGHGLPVALLEEQAAALGVPLVTGATTWDDYEATFVGVLHELRRQGIEAGVFGDIDLEGHRVWVEGVCGVAELSCHLPLWQEPRRRLIDELLAGGVRATVVAVDAAKLDVSFLGREITSELVAELEAVGADACGEEGEYHTMVTATPLFSAPVPLVWKGLEERDGHWVLKFTTA